MSVWYRIVDSRSTDGVHLYIRAFPVLRTTPCGAWLDDYGTERWVSNTSRKRLAHANLDEAVVSFRARKRRQLSMLKAQLYQAEEALALASRYEADLIAGRPVCGGHLFLWDDEQERSA